MMTINMSFKIKDLNSFKEKTKKYKKNDLVNYELFFKNINYKEMNDSSLKVYLKIESSSIKKLLKFLTKEASKRISEFGIIEESIKYNYTNDDICNIIKYLDYHEKKCYGSILLKLKNKNKFDLWRDQDEKINNIVKKYKGKNSKRVWVKSKVLRQVVFEYPSKESQINAQNEINEHMKKNNLDEEVYALNYGENNLIELLNNIDLIRNKNFKINSKIENSILA